MDNAQSEPLAKKQKRQDDTDNVQGPLFPQEVLQKIASMYLSDGVERLDFRHRLPFAAVNRPMYAAIGSGLDRMQRRQVEIYAEEDHVKINDIVVKNKLSSGYTQAECVDALLAFGRPNDIFFYAFKGRLVSAEQSRTSLLPRSVVLRRDRVVSAKGILASIPPLAVSQLDLQVPIEEFAEGTPFYEIMTSIGEMVNLERLKIYCSSDHLPAAVPADSPPSVPPGSPFLQLLKLEKLQTLRLEVEQDHVLTAAQRADLINRSSSNITHLCGYFHPLFTSLNTRARARITSVCCVEHVSQLQSMVERLPQCTDVSAIGCQGVKSRETIDELGNQLLESAVAPGHNKNLTVRIGLFPDDFARYLTSSEQIEFTYEYDATIVRVSLESQAVVRESCPFHRNPRLS